MVDNNFTIVENEEKYWDFIRSLRNELKEYFIIQKEITPVEHKKFMQQYGDCYLICLEGDKPIGFVGNVDGDIRIATIPTKQTQGVGLFMLTELRKRGHKGMAKVKIENQPSLGLFMKAGYRLAYYLLVPSEEE